MTEEELAKFGVPEVFGAYIAGVVRAAGLDRDVLIEREAMAQRAYQRLALVVEQLQREAKPRLKFRRIRAKWAR